MIKASVLSEMSSSRKAGPTEEEPFAVVWAEQPLNVLRAFLVVYPDSDGFDYTCEQVAEYDLKQAVAECERVQRECSKLIDKPWASVCLEVVMADLEEPKKGWKWSDEDSQALGRLVKEQEALAKCFYPRQGSKRVS